MFHGSHPLVFPIGFFFTPFPLLVSIFAHLPNPSVLMLTPVLVPARLSSDHRHHTRSFSPLSHLFRTIQTRISSYPDLPAPPEPPPVNPKLRHFLFHSFDPTAKPKNPVSHSLWVTSICLYTFSYTNSSNVQSRFLTEPLL
jgi:hypothetical protein